MPNRVPWSKDHLLAAFRLYCQTEFGKLHSHNPDIIALAEILGRTPSSVGMKACNFASLDPEQKARNIKALGNVSKADRELWDQFHENPEAVAAEAEAAYARLAGLEKTVSIPEPILPDGPTEIERTVRARRVQSFFRATVLASYENRCALSDITIPQLLNASHIVPWKDNTHRRADPRNGIALNVLYDRAFDRGLISFDDNLQVILSPALRKGIIPDFQRTALINLEGRPLRLPQHFSPDPEALAYHRDQIFTRESSL